MKIAIIGSREGFTEREIVSWLVNDGLDHPNSCTIISGGAIGVDRYVKNFAEKYNLKYVEVRPENPAIKKDYILRNFKIVDMSDEVIVFWDGKSKGTKSVIDYANKIGKKIAVIPKRILD